MLIESCWVHCRISSFYSFTLKTDTTNERQGDRGKRAQVEQRKKEEKNMNEMRRGAKTRKRSMHVRL